MNRRESIYKLMRFVTAGMIIVPLLAVFVSKYLLSVFGTPSPAPAYTIDLTYQPSSEAGIPDRLVGNAPPNMELAVYLNDRLLDLTQSDAYGEYSVPLPVLAERRNHLAVLPTQIDLSTLLVYYLPDGFQRLRPVHVSPDPDPPYLAYSNWTDEGLLVYGSTEATSELELYANQCDENQPHVATVADDEGSFQALIPTVKISPASVEQLCILVRYGAEQSWASYQLDLPGKHSSALLKRSIDLVFSPNSMEMEFSVQLPTGYKVYQNLVDRNISESDFIEYIFGKTTLNTFIDPDKLNWRQEKQENSNQVLVIIESDPLIYLIPEDEATTLKIDTTQISEALPPYQPQDRITVQLQGVQIIKSDPPPSMSNEKQHTWTGPFTGNRTFLVWSDRGSSSEIDSIQRARLKKTLSKLLTTISIVPESLLEQTVEGGIVGILPSRAPHPAQAQVYDYYRSLYEKDPLVSPENNVKTLHTFVRDLPFRLSGETVNILLGSLWLIPSLLFIWIIRKEPERSKTVITSVDKLTNLAWGTALLVILSLNWLPFFNRMGVSRDDYVVWVLSTHAILLLAVWQFNARFASTDPIHRGRTSLLFIILALAITGLSASTLIYLPDAWGTSILTGVSILIIASLVWQAIKIALDEEYRPAIGLLIVILLTIIGISLPIQDLPLRAQMSGVAGVSTLALGTIRPLIPLALLAGLSATLAKKFDKPIGKPLKPIERDLGRVILVAFAVGFSPSWGFIPISVFISLVFFEWILPEKKFASTRAVEQFAKEHQKQAVSALLDLNRELRLWNSAEVDLQKQIKAGKIKIQEYEAQSKEHEDKSRELTRPEFLEGFEETTSVRNLAFNFGAGPRHKDNLRLAIVWGSIFLIPLTLVQGWPLVTAEVQNSLPFPFIHIASRLGVFIGQFLAMAVFLGHFFPYLRGRNGLEKGGWLAGTIVFSLLPAQLIIADSTIDLMALIFWAGTILAYTLLIGLLAFDLRTLSELGLRWNRLTDLYNFRELTFYLTGSGAPLFTTIFSVIAGSLNDLVPAILKVVFPTVTLSGAQNELLRVLLELASQIGTEVLK